MAVNQYSKIDKREFLTQGANPEAMNAAADARDNSTELASAALGSTNKQLYDYLSSVLETSLQGIVESHTTEFEKLSQQIYSNIAEIINDKVKSGDMAEALASSLDAYKEGDTSKASTATTTQEQPASTAEAEPLEVDRVHETIKQEQEHIIPKKEIITQIQPKIEKITEKVAEPAPQDTTKSADHDELCNKLKLLMVYLKSQKLDIFKMLAGVDEDLISIRDKRAEIDLDYEEELRRRQNIRRDFNRKLALDSKWYEDAFGTIGQPSEEQPAEKSEERKAAKDEESKEEKSTEEKPTEESPKKKPVWQAAVEQQAPEEQQPKVAQRGQAHVGFLKSALTKVTGLFDGKFGKASAANVVIVVVPSSVLAKVQAQNQQKKKAAKKPSFLKRVVVPKKPPKSKKLPKPPQSSKGSRKGLWQRAKEAVQKKVVLSKFKKDSTTKYYKYQATVHVKNQKSIKLWGQEKKFKKLTKKMAKELGITDDLVKGNKPFNEEKLIRDLMPKPERRKQKKRGKLLGRTAQLPKFENPEKRFGIRSMMVGIGRRIGGGISRVASRVKTRVKAAVSKVWAKVKTSVSRAVKKVWGKVKRGMRKVWNKVKNTAVKIAKKLWAAFKKIAVKVAKAAWKVTKKVVAATYKAVTQMIVTTTRAIGRGLRSAGKAVAKVPYVGPILGPILMAIGQGLVTASAVMKRAFAAIGKAAKIVTQLIEKAVVAFAKAINKLKKGASKAQGVFRQVKGFKAMFTNFGRKIRAWTTRAKMNSLTKKALSGIRDLSKPLNLKVPKFKFEPKWGSRSIKEESLNILQSIYTRSTDMLKGAVDTAYGWISGILTTVGSNMTEVLSSIAQRLAVVATIGFKGFLKALFSPRALIPIALLVVVLFRKRIFGWLQKHGLTSIKGIFEALKNVGLRVWGFLKSAGNTLLSMGKWLWRQSDPEEKFTIGWWITKAVTWAFKIAKWVTKHMLILCPKGIENAFLYGAAFGGYPYPLMGAMLRQLATNIGKKIWVWYKRYIRSLVEFWVPRPFKNVLLRLLHLDDVPGLRTSTGAVKSLDEVLQKTQSNETAVIKLTTNLSTQHHINPALKQVGLPDLDKFNKDVIQRAREGNSAIETYKNFLIEAAKPLTDKNKTATTSPGFYASQQITEALLSVFFFRDPLSGDIMSTIPKQNIPGVVAKIQKLVLDGAKKGPKALAQANTDVLNYFDYMNRGRSRVLSITLDKYNHFIENMATANADKQRKMAKEFAEGIKSHKYAYAALASFSADAADKAAGRASKSGDPMASSGDIGKGSMRSGGARSLLKASSSDEGSVVVRAGRGLSGAQAKAGGMYVLNADDLKKQTKTPRERGRDKALSWKIYAEQRAQLLRQGKTQDEVRRLGYGMSYGEWSDQYEKNKDKDLPKNLPAPKGQQKAKTGAEGAVSWVAPKIVLPTPRFVYPKEQVKISLPGLTRDIKEGTKPFALYQMNLQGQKQIRRAKGNEKAAAWSRYAEQRASLLKQGKTQDDLKKLGLDLSYGEWSKKYEAEHAEQEKNAKPQEAQEKAVEKENKAEKQQEKKPETPIDQTKMPADFLGAVKKLNELQKAVRNAFLGLTAAGAVKGLKIKKVDGSDENLDAKPKPKPKPKSVIPGVNAKVMPVGEEKEDFLFKKTKVTWYKASGGVVQLGANVRDELSTEKMKTVADMAAPSPKAEQLTLLENNEHQENLYRSAGVSLVSEAQWVSAQEAHKLEAKIIQDAKDVRDIIRGLNIMGSNLENAKIDLKSNLEGFKKKPVGRVITLPTRVVPGGLEISIPEEMPAYDPLPPI